MEFAVLIPPWPDWTNIEFLEIDITIITVAERVLSAHAGDSLDPNQVSQLLSAMVASTTIAYARLYTFNNYRNQLQEKMDSELVKHYTVEIEGGPTVSVNPNTKSLSSESPGYITICCNAESLFQVGLPSTFLRQFNNDDQIGLIDEPYLGKLTIDEHNSIEKMINQFDVIIMPGGEHYFDCLIASKRFSENELVHLIVRAINKLGWEANYLGKVANENYEYIYRNTLK